MYIINIGTLIFAYMDISVKSLRAVLFHCMYVCMPLVIFALQACSKGNGVVLQNQTDQYDDIILNIAYSLIDDGYPINTYEHFQNSIALGFNSLKTDLRLSADNQLVLCHDPGFTLNSKGRITNYSSDGNNVQISRMTSGEITLLEHATAAVDGSYCHPLLFNDYLGLCKQRKVIPYITVREEKVDETLGVLMSSLERSQMLDSAIINIFPPSVNTCAKIRKMNKSVYISYTVGSGEPVSRGLINYVSSVGNCFLCVHKKNLVDLSYELWDYASVKGVKILAWDVGEREEYESLIAKGLKGAQIIKQHVINGR